MASRTTTAMVTKVFLVALFGLLTGCARDAGKTGNDVSKPLLATLDGSTCTDAGESVCSLGITGRCIATGEATCCAEHAREVDLVRECTATLTGPESVYDCYVSDVGCMHNLSEQCWTEPGPSGRSLEFLYPPSEETIAKHHLTRCNEETTHDSIIFPNCE